MSRAMSRHSKWSKVKQFKGAIDAKRSASFTKLAREITVAVREKGGDPSMNARLRAAIDRARDASMPKDAIERAIARGTGADAEGQIDSLTYEAYLPAGKAGLPAGKASALGGTALIIECLTDNRNRTANDVKHILSKGGGILASTGAVTYLFDRLGVVRVPRTILSDDQELALIDAGATDIVKTEGAVEVRSLPQDLARVADAVAKLGWKFDSAEFEWVPKTLIEADEETGTKAAGFIEELEAHDDVSRVFSNLA